MQNLTSPITNCQLPITRAKRGYFRATARKQGSRRSRGSYIALVSFLVISAVVLVIGITLALLGVSEAQMGLSEKRGHYALGLAEGCAEDALLSAYYDGSYSGGTKSYPEGSCAVMVTKVGNDWTMVAAATVSGHTKKVEVKINRGNEIVVTSWKEIE